MKREVNNGEVVLTLDQIDPITIYGVNDEYLKILEDSFPIQLIARGNKLKIRGEKSLVEQMENIVGELVFVANRNGHLTKEDVETIVHVVKAFPRTAAGKVRRDALLRLIQ